MHRQEQGLGALQQRVVQFACDSFPLSHALLAPLALLVRRRRREPSALGPELVFGAPDEIGERGVRGRTGGLHDGERWTGAGESDAVE